MAISINLFTKAIHSVLNQTEQANLTVGNLLQLSPVLKADNWRWQ
jgi:hypothetical protein